MKVDVKGGSVTLRDRLDFTAGQAIRFAIAVTSEQMKASYGVTNGSLPAEAIPDLMAAIHLNEILRGVESWTFPEPVTRQNIHALILDDPDRATVVASACDDLYQAQVIGPLATLAASSSPPLSTDEPTSAPTESNSSSEDGESASTPSPTPRKRSKQSSTSTTPTGSTETTSAELAGASKS